MSKIGFLGPRGTFSEEAIINSLGIEEHNLESYPSASDVIKAVSRREINAGVVPVENSIEGSVNVTLDTLVFDSDVLIQKEIISNIHHNLIASSGTGINEIKKVYSHPQPAAQCRKYLSKNVPQAKIFASSSTAEAVKFIKNEPNSAAIGSELAANLYGLEILEKSIEDFKGNQTRFVLIGKKKTESTGNDKTSIACFIKKDRPGSLLEILQEFADKKINLTKIQSRPTKDILGQYYFWIDLEGHIEDEPISNALHNLEPKLQKIRFLGSYPKDNNKK